MSSLREGQNCDGPGLVMSHHSPGFGALRLSSRCFGFLFGLGVKGSPFRVQGCGVSCQLKYQTLSSALVKISGLKVSNLHVRSCKGL